MAKNISGNGAFLVEGEGGVPFSPIVSAQEKCGSNPFRSNVPNPIVDIIETWLQGTDHFDTGPLYNLGRLKNFPKSEVKKVISETWVGSQLEIIKLGLVSIGLAKKKNNNLNEAIPSPGREMLAKYGDSDPTGEFAKRYMGVPGVSLHGSSNGIEKVPTDLDEAAEIIKQFLSWANPNSDFEKETYQKAIDFLHKTSK